MAIKDLRHCGNRVPFSMRVTLGRLGQASIIIVMVCIVMAIGIIVDRRVDWAKPARFYENSVDAVCLKGRDGANLGPLGRAAG